MNKNFVITYLVIAVIVLVGIIMMTIFELFSENWLISLAIILIAFAIAIGLAFLKLKK